MRLSEELERRGCTLSIQAFEEIVLVTFEAMFPETTDEDVICDTFGKARRFVLAVREKIGLGCASQPIPSWVINKTLINLRKRSKTERRTSRQLKPAKV
jgi:hypothetical protein